MGFISSASTVYLDLHTTEYGREFLLQGGLGDKITKFTLGDSDTDYKNTTNLLPAGYVPDVTGAHNDCIFGVNNGFEVKYKLAYITGMGSALNQAEQESNMMFMFLDNQGSKTYSKSANVEVYMHDLMVLYKAFSHAQAKYQTWSGFSAKTYEDWFTTTTDSEGFSIGRDMASLYYKLADMGRDFYLDIYDGIVLQRGGMFENTNIKLVPQTPYDLSIFKKLTGAAVIEQTGQSGRADFYKGARIGLQTKTTIRSPYSLTTSSAYDGNGNVFAGAGPFGIAFGLQEYGYVVGDGLNPQDPSYTHYGFSNEKGGFYQGVFVENDANARSLGQFNNIVPAARIATDNKFGYYYPLNPVKQLNVSVKKNVFKATPQSHFEGTTLTQSSSALETFLSFAAGTAEYRVGTPSAGYDKTLSVNWVDSSTEPYTMLTRHYDYMDSFFTALNSDSDVSNSITLSGGVNNYNINFKMTLLAYSTDFPGVAPAKISVTFIFDKNAMKESVAWDSSTNQKAARWRLFGNTNVRFYGENYKDLSGGNYAVSPLNNTNDAGGSIFRKVTLS
tara:strand:+ start:2752 stop:4425 length:1674 start_codon:yes stop_codon:yes gene_type:complete